MKKCLSIANLIPLLILLVMMSSGISSKTYAYSEKNLEQVCQLSPTQCLEDVNIELKRVKQKSRLWYSLMQFKLSSLFILQHGEELYQETKRWIHEDDLPFAFQVTLYIYYAKSCIYYGDREEGIKYIYKAKEKLAVMNGVYPAPIKLIEIANLQLYIGEFSEAYASLNALKKKYRNSQNPHFMMELNAHLGHVARKLGYFDEALAHWHETLPWSYKYGNEQQIATVLFNLGQAQHHEKQYLLAEQSYLTAIIHAEKAQDVIKAFHARLYLAEIKLIMGEKEQAKALLLLLDEKQLSQPHLEKYKELTRQL